MSALPERYQRYAQTGQRNDPVAIYQPADVQLYDERDPVVWIPGAYGEMVPVRKSQAPATIQPAPVRDLTPQPILDPVAQRTLAVGVSIGAAGAGVGYGLGQIAAGIALMGTSGLAILVGLLLAVSAMRGRGSTHIQQTVNVQQKWFGRSTTNL